MEAPRPPGSPGMVRSITHRLAGEQFSLPVEGRLAPFTEARGWINSEALTPQGLRGRVVLVDFWTYTCVNWLRTLPYVRAWAAKYADAGLTVVGVHTPEFGFEHDVDNVKAFGFVDLMGKFNVPSRLWRIVAAGGSRIARLDLHHPPR